MKHTTRGSWWCCCFLVCLHLLSLLSELFWVLHLPANPEKLQHQHPRLQVDGRLQPVKIHHDKPVRLQNIRSPIWLPATTVKLHIIICIFALSHWNFTARRLTIWPTWYFAFIFDTKNPRPRWTRTSLATLSNRSDSWFILLFYFHSIPLSET